MRLSTRARYAIRAMIEIARSMENKIPASLEAVSKRTGISRRYLEQIIIDLKKAQLVKGVAGRTGGYILNKPSKEISLDLIVRATIGPINIVNCVMKPETCLKSKTCECRSIYQTINSRITEVFKEFTLDDLVSGLGERIANGSGEERKDIQAKDQTSFSLCQDFEPPLKR